MLLDLSNNQFLKLKIFMVDLNQLPHNLTDKSIVGLVVCLGNLNVDLEIGLHNYRAFKQFGVFLFFECKMLKIGTYYELAFTDSSHQMEFLKFQN